MRGPGVGHIVVPAQQLPALAHPPHWDTDEEAWANLDARAMCRSHDRLLTAGLSMEKGLDEPHVPSEVAAKAQAEKARRHPDQAF